VNAAAGRSVPEDISVIGIGGGALGVGSTPQLTRIDLALDICGKAALDFIAARVGGANPPAQPPDLAAWRDAYRRRKPDNPQ
jgi:LacI family transcriptional regulator